MNRSVALFACLVASSCSGLIEGGGALDPGAGPSGTTGQATGGGGNAGTDGGTGVNVIGSGAAGTAAIDPRPPSGGMGGAAGSASSTAGMSGSDTGTPTQGCSPNGLPPDVQAVFTARCVACHGNPPIAGVPASLTSYAALTSRSKTDPTKTVAQVAIVRMQSATMPMPPAPVTRASSAEIATIQQWVAAGTPKNECPAGTDGGADAGVADAGPPLPDPFSAPPVCTSKQMWTGGNRGSGSMNPGLACIACHSMGRGPGFAIAGTLYPTAHEPDLCNGVNGTTGAKIVIVGADGQMQTLTPNGAGNFSYQGTIATPYQAKVVYMGRERAMIEPQTSGDCNNCHTQNGSMPSGTLKAPGRILSP
jgi:mono/diheme cytochrome c family protein